MTRLPNGGRIEVICGCMFSGKTEELIRRLNHVHLARQRLLAFTPRRDTRYRTGSLVSHNGQKIEAITVASIADIVTAVPVGTQVVAIDEVQFLESDPQAHPFAIVAELMAIAEQVDKLFAICVKCGSYATRSQRLIDGLAAPHSAPVIAVGGLELYEARCRICYEVGIA
ncbi:MAG: thymidine kinase [Chloroflexales bacterium]|nr:thymidine kinase [Chloroflexales bacterium]